MTHAHASTSVCSAQRAIAVDLLADVLARRGEHRLVAHGHSMSGAITSGSVIRLRCAASSEEIAFGDVVAARVRGGLVVHRVVGRDACDRFLLKGDACPWPDGWIERHEVIGFVVAIDDGGGFRAAGPPRPQPPRWRRALHRLRQRSWPQRAERVARTA